jgi:quercetin dioxygenase-like cupin family protein
MTRRLVLADRFTLDGLLHVPGRPGAGARAGCRIGNWAMPTKDEVTGMKNGEEIGVAARPPGPRVLLRSEESGGELSVIETSPAPGVGPPFHKHDFDETFYVLEGELTFRVPDEFLMAGPGELVFAPRGVPHTFANLSDDPARQLIVCAPAGFERYFARMAAERLDVEPPDWALQPIPEVTRLGPPIDPDQVPR